MQITTFDLYGNENSNSHGINTYHDVIFDGKRLIYSNKSEKEVSKNELTNILNKTDYKICHNFYGYDGLKLPCLKDHYSNNIDTLLIDCLISFNKTHHNLKKSIDNNPLEDATTTFEVLEKNIIKFYRLPIEIKNILYSLLNSYEKYNDFFIFYNKLGIEKLSIISNDKIIENFGIILSNKNINSSKSLNIIEKNISENNKTNNLSIAYLAMFIYTNTIQLPDFIFKENSELKNILRNLLNEFYSYISLNLHTNIKIYLKAFSQNKIPNFRLTQGEGVKNSLENKDFFTLLSTGGGKSLIYQLPAWLVGKKLGHLTLIITPLKALIKDQIDGLKYKNFNEVNYLSGDQNGIEKDIIYNKIKSGETKILFLTPEALRSEKLLDLLQNRYISRVVIDEAHTIILWGQEFRPDYFFIKYFIEDIEKRNLNKKINITLLTATATVDVEEGIVSYFEDRKINLIKSKDILKENIKGSVINIKNENDKIDILLNKIKEINVDKNPTIIFTGRRKTAEEIEQHMIDEGINAKYFHAGMYLNEKKQVQEDFISGKLNLIVATKAFGMGIDKENVRCVIHYDLPGNIEDYTQEIGRAGRDGNKSHNIIFYDKKEIEKRIKNLSFSGLKYYNIQNFLKYVKLSKDKDKYVLSPRQIAIQSGIKTNKNNWITDIKILLSFLELEKFDGESILRRKYDNTYVLFNKIEENIVTKSYTLIAKNLYLNDLEKELAKEIVYKIVEQKIAIDLNKLEENFIEDLGDDFNFKKINVNKITNTIKSLNILSKSKETEEADIVIEAGFLLNDNEIFEKYEYIVSKINTYDKNQNSLNNIIKNYYLFKNFKINDNELIIKHYALYSSVGKIILGYIYKEKRLDNNKKSVDLNKLLTHLQLNYKKNYTISELKEALFFLDRLGIIKVRNGLLVFLTRFSIYFDKSITSDLETFRKKILTKDFEKELISKLEIFKEVKINKLLALQKIVEILDSRGISEYTKLTEYYFNTQLKSFAKEYLIKEIS